MSHCNVARVLSYCYVEVIKALIFSHIIIEIGIGGEVFSLIRLIYYAREK